MDGPAVPTVSMPSDRHGLDLVHDHAAARVRAVLYPLNIRRTIRAVFAAWLKARHLPGYAAAYVRPSPTTSELGTR